MNKIDMTMVEKNNFYKDYLLHLKKKVSGEIFKEPFLDILLTDLEQTSFSLIASNLKKEMQTGMHVPKQSFGLQRPRHNKNEVFVRPRLCKRASIPTSIRIEAFKPEPYKNKVRHTQLAHQKVIKFVFNSRNNNLKTSNYLFALDKWADRDIFFTSYISFLFNSSVKNKKSCQALKSTTKLNFSDSLQNKKPISCLLKIGDYVHCGDKLGYFFGNDASQSKALGRTLFPLVISESGKLLKISRKQVTIQKMQPVLFYSQAEIHVESNEWVKRGTPLLTLAHQTLVTGDIIQGIPRIEQLFEASTSAPPGTALQDFDFQSEDQFALSIKGQNKVPVAETSFTSKLDKALPPSNITKANVEQSKHPGFPQFNLNTNQLVNSTTQPTPASTAHFIAEEKPLLLYQTLQSQARENFRKKWNRLPLPLAVRQSLEEIQQIIVESIQKVYISQGVLIADKHIEIIVRQMTSKAQIFDGGSTGLLIDEILSLQQIENANISTPGQKAVYLPVIMGLTRAALSSDSFVSAASFQETTRVLSRDAVAGKTDFLRGLKEKVIIGDLIDAGTGLDMFYTYSLFSKSLFENKFRDILNRKITHKTLKKLVLTVTKCYPDSFRCTNFEKQGLTLLRLKHSQ